MFFFYGWGHRTTKVFGTKNEICPICSNRDIAFQFIRVRTWFTLFFIPVIPYSSKYYKVCPHCQNSFELEKDEFLLEVERSFGLTMTPVLETEISGAENKAANPGSTLMREITVTRGKKLFASMFKINIYVDGNIVAEVKNGQTVKFFLDHNKHNMYMTCKTVSGEARSNIIPLEEYGENIKFNLTVKSDIEKGIDMTVTREW